MDPQAPHPVISVLTNGIVRETHENRKAGFYRAALILAYCGIDQVSYLALPAGAIHASKQDFCRWVDRYMPFPEGGTSMELYAARCGLAHKYGSDTKLHQDGTVKRQLGYCFGGAKRVFSAPTDPNLVLVDIDLLVDRFIKGVTDFCKDLTKAEPEYLEAVNDRLHSMLDITPLQDLHFHVPLGFAPST